MAEDYLRTRNRMLTEYAPAVQSTLLPDTRGIVNELGFRLYVKSLELRKPLGALPREITEPCFTSTVRYVQTLSDTEPTREAPPFEEAIEESMRLAHNIGLFFRFARARTRFKIRTIGVSPLFKGCGWLDECAADFLTSNVLVEIKAGDRTFRSIDIRQVLIYCALNFASKTYDIVHVCLVNPRLGFFWGEPLERLCQEVSGRSSSDVLGDIVQFVSDPVDRYMAG